MSLMKLLIHASKPAKGLHICRIVNVTYSLQIIAYFRRRKAVGAPTWKEGNVAAIDCQSVIEVRLLHKGNPDSAYDRQPPHQRLQGQPNPAREEEVAHPDPHSQEIGDRFANSKSSAQVDFGEGLDDQLDILLACPCDINLDYNFTTDILCLVHLCMRYRKNGKNGK